MSDQMPEMWMKMVDALLVGLPPERHFQAKTFFNQTYDQVRTRNPSLELIGMVFPISRRIIEIVHPPDTKDLAESLVTYCKAQVERTDGVKWFYDELEDPEVDYLADIADAFVRDWNDQHRVS